jgi:hypothetical protein
MHEISNPSKTLRIAVMDCIALIMISNPILKLHAHIEKIEQAIQFSSIDPASEVRSTSKIIFDSYKDLFPERLDSYYYILF